MEIPQKYREELEILRTNHNYRAFSVLALILFVSCVVFLLQNIFIPDQFSDEWVRNAYFRFYVGALVFSPLYAFSLFTANHFGSRRVVYILCVVFSFTVIALGLALTILAFQDTRNLTSVFLASLGVTVMFSGPIITYILTSSWLLVLFFFAYLFFFHTIADASLIVAMAFLATLIFVFGLYAEHIRLKANLSTIRMRELTLRDQLTGAYNRLFLNEYVKKLICARNRYNSPLSCILIDIDHFKEVNDTWGHQIGDHVLVTLVKTLREKLRDSDTITRMGGEEFLIVLPETPLYSALIVAEKLRIIVEKIPFDGFSVTISLGVCEFHKDESFKSAFSRCDAALYQAKKGGRNRVAACPERTPVTCF